MARTHARRQSEHLPCRSFRSVIDGRAERYCHVALGDTVTGPKAALAGVLLQPTEPRGLIEKLGLASDGDLGVLDTLASVTDTFEPTFNMVTP